MIGKLSGHRQIETTARYAHLARDTVQESAARVAKSLAAEPLRNRLESAYDVVVQRPSVPES